MREIERKKAIEAAKKAAQARAEAEEEAKINSMSLEEAADYLRSNDGKKAEEEAKKKAEQEAEEA